VRITDLTGTGIRVAGLPTVDFTARRWTSEHLDAAQHTTDLVPDDQIHLNVDFAQHGIGSASCGPGVLPPHRLEVQPTTFAIAMSLTSAPFAKAASSLARDRSTAPSQSA